MIEWRWSVVGEMELERSSDGGCKRRSSGEDLRRRRTGLYDHKCTLWRRQDFS